MIRGDNIQSAVFECCEQGQLVGWRFDGRIALDPVAEAGIVFAGEMQEVNTHFGGDIFAVDGSGIEQFHFPCRGEVEDVQLRVVISGQFNGHC